jgi:GAF domain-containing protein
MNDMIMRVVDRAVQDAMEMQRKGVPKNKILAGLVAAAEHLAGGGAVSSILLLDKQGLLRNGASPQLPHDYLNAIDGLKPHPKVGTCAAAAATGSMVVTLDFMADDKWAELRHLPTALGFTGAWSMPIKNAEGKVLGTFGTYFREKREPSPAEIIAIKLLAETAARIVS